MFFLKEKMFLGITKIPLKLHIRFNSLDFYISPLCLFMLYSLTSSDMSYTVYGKDIFPLPPHAVWRSVSLLME